jgi:hypothetical protein
LGRLASRGPLGGPDSGPLPPVRFPDSGPLPPVRFPDSGSAGFRVQLLVVWKGPF